MEDHLQAIATLFSLVNPMVCAMMFTGLTAGRTGSAARFGCDKGDPDYRRGPDHCGACGRSHTRHLRNTTGCVFRGRRDRPVLHRLHHAVGIQVGQRARSRNSESRSICCGCDAGADNPVRGQPRYHHRGHHHRGDAFANSHPSSCADRHMRGPDHHLAAADACCTPIEKPQKTKSGS